MGQVALGLRSLAIKLVIFFVMAALLAWALGGTLFPRAEIVELEPVAHEGRQWFWRLSVGGRVQGAMRWQLMSRADGGDAAAVDEQVWAGVAGPVVASDGLYYAGRSDPREDGRWWIHRLAGDVAAESFPMPDRLAVEQQLARLGAGLALQDAETILAQRRAVIDPPE